MSNVDSPRSYERRRLHEAARPAGSSAGRLATAGVLAITMVVLLAAFGVAGQAASSLSHTFGTVGRAVVLHRADESRAPTVARGSGSGIASLHAVPSPGYFCAARGSTHVTKLILTQERFDRLVARGWGLAGGPGTTRQLALLSCPRYGNDDGND
jgi:hypothetical protein